MSRRITRLIGKSIAGRYRIVGEIGAGGMGRVLRAMPYDDPSQDVAVKVILRNREINSEDLIRFQKEAALMSRLLHPHIVCFYELGIIDAETHRDIGHGYYIVMEIASGRDLKQILTADGRLDLEAFFQIAIKVADALDYTHGKNILHRDIKPNNIIFEFDQQNPDASQVKVLDFGVARLAESLDSYSSEDQGGKDVAGTPLYMAPEQSGLIEAAVDHRADLYALGCVLYEVLSGRPPFTAPTREKLERDHAFAKPEPLSNLRPDVPPLVESLIHRLLAKHPDERLQTAFSLRADLLRMRDALRSSNRSAGTLFALGSNDRFRSVAATIPLIGRQEALSKLVEGYDSLVAEKGRSRLCAVSGIAGSGKSRLLREFRTYLQRRRIRVIHAQFSQHENSLPFNALANGFNEYLINLQRNQPIEADEIRRKIRTLLGAAAQQIVRVVPAARGFVDEVTSSPDHDLPESSAEIKEDQEFANFAKTFSDFVRCLATDQHALVFAFDDLHWADEKSLELIDQFFSHNNSQRFYLAISYRCNDPMASKKFDLFLEKFRKLRRRFEEIVLEPLRKEETKELLRQMLDISQDPDNELVDYLDVQAKGIPLYIVEMVRTLVANDVLHCHSRSIELRWELDKVKLQSANLRYNSIDLVMGKLVDYRDFHTRMLEIAAVVGMIFPERILSLESEIDAATLRTILDQAIKDGLITLASEDQGLSHLGIAYRFTHWRVRDLLYRSLSVERRQTIHSQIANMLLPEMFQAVGDKRPSAKLIFAFAHHMNRSLGDSAAADALTAQRCVDANILAGEESLNSGAFQSAQRHYECAQLQIDGWWQQIPDIAAKRGLVLEALGDLAALQRRNGDAAKLYEQTSTLQKNSRTFATISYKRIKLLLVGGLVSHSFLLLRQTLHQLQISEPRDRLWMRMRLVVDVFWDLLPQLSKYHRHVRALRRLAKTHGRKMEQSRSQSMKIQDPIVKLHELAQIVYEQYEPASAKIAAFQSLILSKKRNLDPESLIKATAERGALLARLGKVGLAFKIFDTAMTVAQYLKLRNVYGYMCLLRSIYLDYPRDRDEEVKINLNAASKYLSSHEERIWRATAVEFAMFRSLAKGRIKVLQELRAQISDFVQTRNWISPRGTAIVFYSWLIADMRDHIVPAGEQYLRRREQVSGRQHDLFITIIKTILFFAKGESEKCRHAFREVAHHFLGPRTRRSWLYPFEEDFVGLFVLSFLPIYEQEYGQTPASKSFIRNVYDRLRRQILSAANPERGIASLLLARCAEMTNRKSVKIFYDRALQSAKVSDNQLLAVFAHLWFGDFLLRGGAKFRNEYLRRAHDGARSLGLNALVEYSEKLMEQRKVDFRRAQIQRESEPRAPRPRLYRSQLIYEHLRHVSTVIGMDRVLEQNVEESLAVLGRYYLCQNVYVLIADDSPKAVQPWIVVGGSKDQHRETSLFEYVAPYFGVRSTLFLPVHDAPWQNQIFEEVNGDEKTAVINTSERFSSTKRDERLADSGVLAMTRRHTLNAKVMSGAEKEGDDQRESHHQSSQVLRMNSLIPIHFRDRSMGIIFLEDVDLSYKDTSQCREELDMFGSQLGLMVAKNKISFSQPFSDAGTLELRVGEACLESVEWLRLWSHGKMRTGRETGWYLGVNLGSAFYILLYGRFNGPQNERDRLSREVWYHLHGLVTLARRSGRAELNVVDIREELSSLLHANSEARTMESMSIAFTIFDRQNRRAYSGHFGPSRPLVIGQSNQITPENRTILTLANGRDLRFWSVNASLQTPHIYLLTHDSSRLESNPSETQRRSLSSNLIADRSMLNPHVALESVIIKEHMPRYYVGAVLLEENFSTKNSGNNSVDGVSA